MGVIRAPMKQKQSSPRPRQQPDTAQAPSFESAPWSPRDLVLEDPRRPGEAPLRLLENGHVVTIQAEGGAHLRDQPEAGNNVGKPPLRRRGRSAAAGGRGAGTVVPDKYARQ